MPCDEDMDNIVASSQSSEELNVGSSAAPIVNPKSMVESIKAHLIGTSKLLNQLETAAEQCEAGNLKLSKLAKELAPHTAENIKLREQLAKETSAIMDLEGKLVRLTGSDDTTSTYDSLQSDLTTAIEDTDHVDSRIRSCDIYIKQLEAQVMNLDEQLKGPIPEPKKTKRTIRSFEIKENQIKELQQNINKAINAKESAENDKMEINITCKMLQKDYDVLKETMMKQQQQHDVALAVLEKQYQTLLGEIQQQETLLNTSTNISTTNALNDMHRQLRDNHIYIKQLQDQVERSKQSAHPVQSDLITDFRQCLAEHEKLKMEKIG
ncbi:hypothetical protein BC941DRAFT_239866 [Chlamydoabsidia padenii]|nr:hypothetical protein BC941DRAFT_239866 [Chlamydoabsidia padenii]